MDLDKTQEAFIKTAGRFGKMKYEFLFCNLSKREYEMLSVLLRFMNDNNEKRGMYVSELARKLRVSSPAVSRMIGALEGRGYIGRDVDKEDRRNTFVYLTDKGIRAKEENEERMHSLMQRVMARMGEEDMKEFIKLFNRFADIMEEELEGEKRAGSDQKEVKHV